VRILTATWSCGAPAAVSSQRGEGAASPRNIKTLRRITALMVASASFLFAAEPLLRFGAAAVDITPPADMPFQVPQRPPFPVVVGAGTHDPIHAKAIVFESGGTKAAIVSCDLTSIPVHITAAARAHAGKITGVPPENVMITATHTHTGPNLRPRFYQNASPTQKKVAEAYLARLPQLMAESVQQAEKALTEARLQAAIGQVPDVAFNRRFLMKDGTVVSNPGKGQDELLVNVVRPAGPTDPSLPVLYAESVAGAKPLATVLNFAMHLDTTGGLEYSADYPYQISKILADVKGPEMLTHFTIGAAGNINHYYLLDPKKPRRTKGFQEAARIGTLVAAEVVRTYQRLQPITTAPLKVSREVLRLLILEEKAPVLAKQFGNKPEFDDGEMMVKLVDGKYTFEAEVMVITVGDELAFVGLPGEMFVELGFAVKQGSPYQFTFINTLANGAIGYVANRKAYREGGYGASYATTRSNPGSGEALVDSALRQLIAHRAMQPTP
jgi:neutral ceramidase